MITKLILILTCTLNTTTAFAAAKTQASKNMAPTSRAAKQTPGNKKAPSQNLATMSFKMVYGEKATLYAVTRTPQGARVDFVNNFGSRGLRDISPADYEYLVRESVKITNAKYKRENCPRGYMQLTLGQRNTVMCVTSKHPAAKELLATMNTMSLMF